MTNPAYEATNSDERDAFEIAFPLPKHAIRCGSGYACTDYNAWDAQKFVERWEGWKACVLAKTPAPNGMMQLSNELAEMKRKCVELTVWYGAMPESNGKTNWTAILHRKGECLSTGITIDRSEYPDRVRYEADRMSHLIGELTEEPDILAYDANKHSGYTARKEGE